MSVTRGIRRAVVAAAMLAAAAIPRGALGHEPPAEAALEVHPSLQLAQFVYPWEEEKERKERAPKKTNPPSDADTGTKPPAAATPAAPGDTPLVEEVAHKGQVVRALHFASTATLQIQLNGKVIGTVKNVGEMKKPRLLPGTYQSLVPIWTKNAGQDCSSYVLVAIPTGDAGGKAEVKSGFGACNNFLREFAEKRGNWEAWSLIASREDSAKVSVAVSSNGKLAISEQAARPCLFSKDRLETQRCSDEYVAAGLGSVERGIQSGEERAGSHRLATFQNRAKNTGSIELDGKTYKSLTDVKTLHVESAVELPDSVLFSIWLQPASGACGHRTLLRVPFADGGDEVLDRVGECRGKSATIVRRARDNTVTAWAKIMLREGDQQVDIATWTGGKLKLTTGFGDRCLLLPNPPNDCVARVLPADFNTAQPSRAASGTPDSSAPLRGPPIAPPSPPAWGGQFGQSPAVVRGFALLAGNQIDIALAEFDRALIAEPNNAMAYTGRGFGLALKGKLDNAMSDLDRAVQLNPRSAYAFSYRGFVFLLRREPDRALAQLDQALVLDPRLAHAYAFRGSAWLAKGDTGRALADLNTSLGMTPRNPLALGMRAAAYVKLREHEKAVADYTAAIEIAPNTIVYRFGRAQSLEALGRASEALIDYTAAAAMRPMTVNDITSQIIARQRANALGGGGGPAGQRPCPKGEQCL